MCMGCLGELFPLTSTGLPGSSTQPSVASGLGALILTPLRGDHREAGTKHATKAPLGTLLVLTLTPHCPKQTQCEGVGKAPPPPHRSPLPIPTAKAADKGGRIRATSRFSKFPTIIMSLLKSFLLKRIKIMDLRSLKHRPWGRDPSTSPARGGGGESEGEDGFLCL